MRGASFALAPLLLCIWLTGGGAEYPRMSTQFSMIGIMNAALLAQGADEIVADNDGSNEFRMLSRNWPVIVEAELEDSKYYFTREQADLVTRAGGKYGYQDAYLVPDAALHVSDVWISDGNGGKIEVEWVQDGQHVHMNSDEGCVIEYVQVATMDLWTATFTLGIKQRLEALILRGIKEEFREADRMDEKAEATLQRARTNSSKTGSSKSPYKKGPIASARFRRGSR